MKQLRSWLGWHAPWRARSLGEREKKASAKTRRALVWPDRRERSDVESRVRALRLHVRSRMHGYDVLLGANILPSLGKRLRSLKVGRRVAVISDSNVFRRWGKIAVGSLEAAGFSPLAITLPAGERTKTLKVAERIIGKLISGGHARADPVVAL